MSEIREVNAKITDTFLGREDHGIPTFNIRCEWPGGSQGFGGYDLRWWGIEMLTDALEAIGVEKWEKLVGTPVRIRQENTKIHAIGHIIEDRWYCPDEHKAARAALAALENE